MFEAWGRVVYRRRRLVLADSGVGVVAGGACGEPACSASCSRRRLHRPGQPEPARGNLATRAFGRDTADVVVLYSGPDHDRARPGLPGRRDRHAWPPCRAARSPRTQTYWSTGLAAVRQRRRPGRPTPCSSWPVPPTPPGSRTYQAISGRPRRARPDRRRQAGRSRPRRAINKRGHRRHRAGRGHLDAGAADPAAGHLRQPGRRQPAAGDRRHRRSSARSPRCGC